MAVPKEAEMMADPIVIVFISAVFLLAGTVKGVTGMGLPTVGVGLLSLLMTPGEAAALIVAPSLVTNLWQAFAGPGRLPLLRRLWPMLLGICVGTGLGAALAVDAKTAVRTLGAVLALYGGLGLLPKLRPRVGPRAEAVAGPITGLVTGVATAATGVFVIPAAPYLGALGLERDQQVQALGVSFSISTLALAAVVAVEGGFGGGVGFGSLLAVVPASFGVALGRGLRRAMSPETFRRCFFGALVGLGVHLLLRG